MRGECENRQSACDISRRDVRGQIQWQGGEDRQRAARRQSAVNKGCQSRRNGDVHEAVRWTAAAIRPIISDADGLMHGVRAVYL